MQTLSRNPSIGSHLNRSHPIRSARCDRLSERRVTAPPARLDREDVGVDHALIARVRSEIRRGVYDTERRFGVAIVRMLEEVGSTPCGF